MTWPFENDTSDIEKKLAKRSLHRERQRNLFAKIHEKTIPTTIIMMFTNIWMTSFLCWLYSI